MLETTKRRMRQLWPVQRRGTKTVGSARELVVKGCDLDLAFVQVSLAVAFLLCAGALALPQFARKVQAFEGIRPPSECKAEVSRASVQIVAVKGLCIFSSVQVVA
jgi:hypothetical protein